MSKMINNYLRLKMKRDACCDSHHVFGYLYPDHKRILRVAGD